MSARLIPSTPSAYEYPLLIKHLLHTPLVQAPEQEIVYRDLKRYNYRSLRSRIGQLSSGLAKLGIAPGDTVAMMDWDSHRYLECFFAVPMMGAVLQTVNFRLSPEQVLYTINHAKPVVLLINGEFLELFELIKDKLETIKKVVLVTDERSSQQYSSMFAAEYEELLAAGSPDYPFPDFDENTRATTFYTTGTTGQPKGVSFSHRQLVLHTLALLAAFGMSACQGRFHRDDVYMPITPMFHVHAWGLPFAATAAGVKQVYAGRYAPESLLGLIKKEGVTFSHCVSTILHMLLESPAAQDVDLSRWKVAIGGGPLSKGLAKAALERGIDVFSGYGLSETCPLLTIAHVGTSVLGGDPDKEVSIRTKTGLAAPLVDLRIVDECMNDVPHDGKTMGEVVVRAPWLAQCYQNDAEGSERLWAGGYLHNDIGIFDGEGYLQITDRIKDVIKTGGEWISSVQLEDIISLHPAVSEVAVIGVSDPKWGERPAALIVLKPNSARETRKEQIHAHVKEYSDRGVISSFAIPENIIFVDSLAKTSVGKMNKRVLREKYKDSVG